MKHLSIMLIVYILHCENIFYIKKKEMSSELGCFLC